MVCVRQVRYRVAGEFNSSFAVDKNGEVASISRDLRNSGVTLTLEGVL